MNAPISNPPITSDVARLRLDVQALSPLTTVDQAAELFLQPANERMLCLPVTVNDKPVGSISRHQLNGIFLHRYGREIHGSRPISRVMNPTPIVVEASNSLEQAAAYVTSRLGAPITEDFILTENGEYRGMGIVLDLLSALQTRAAESARRLADAYRQLKTSQAQLVQSEKMASLGQMVAGVAHEINTPLGYVRNNVEVMRDVFGQMMQAVQESERLTDLLIHGEPDENALSQQMVVCSTLIGNLRDSQMMEDTHALFPDTLYGTEQIRDLVVNLRNFSRLDQAKLAEISLNDCLDQTLVIANHVLKNKLQITKQYGAIPKVRCSPSQINQVLLNIMTNAAQAIEHDHGRLILKTDSTLGWVHVSLQDNGKGMTPEVLAKIFDPFFTTKSVGQGTGLGLSISYQIVQAHGGHLRAGSQPGVGTRFVMSLPTHGAATATPAESNP